MDAIDCALDERRSKRLEGLLLQRTLKLQEAEGRADAAATELKDFRVASEMRERECTALRSERDEAVRRRKEIEEESRVWERSRDAASRAVSEAAGLELQLRQLQAELHIAQGDVKQLTILGDDQHARIKQLEREKAIAHILDHEDRRRRRAVLAEGTARERMLSEHHRHRHRLRAVTPPRPGDAPDGDESDFSEDASI